MKIRGAKLYHPFLNIGLSCLAASGEMNKVSASNTVLRLMNNQDCHFIPPTILPSHHAVPTGSGLDENTILYLTTSTTSSSSGLSS